MESQLIETRPTIATSSVKLVVGIFFTALGLLLTLDNLDIVDGNRLLRYWPVVLIVVGALKLREAGSRALALILIIAGVLLLGNGTHWIRFSIFDFWPLILIGVGVVIVLHSFGFRVAEPQLGSDPTTWSLFNNRKLNGSAQDFHGRRIIAFMGGCKLDLNDSGIEGGTTVIEVIAVWGGVVIRVPQGWEVVGQAVPIMGGIDIRTGPARGGRKLIVRGLTLMGGMEIKNAKGSTL